MFELLIVPSILLFFCILLIPASPRWLASTNKNRDREAIKRLHNLRASKFEVNNELNEIFNSINFYNKSFGLNFF